MLLRTLGNQTVFSKSAKIIQVRFDTGMESHVKTFLAQ